MREKGRGERILAGVFLFSTILFALGTSEPLLGYTVTGYVWQSQPEGPGPQRVVWHPVTSPGEVNFLSPVSFSVGSGGPAGASAEIKAAFDRWNQVAGPASIRYRLLPTGGDLLVEFVSNPAGVPGETTLSAGGGALSIDSSLVVRTDRFLVDIPPLNTVATDPLDEYDLYTVAVHEVGHDLGLSHRRNGCSTLTAQNFARGVPCPTWEPDPTVPPEGFPAGSLIYNNPRRVLTSDDIRGLRTLYSQPEAELELITASFDKFTKRFHYEYRVINRSISGSDYFLNRIEIPLPGVAAEDVDSPTGFVLGPDTGPDRIVWEAAAGTTGISPGGNSVSGFQFNHTLGPQFGTITAGFGLPNLAEVGTGPNGDFDDPANPSTVDLFYDGIPPVTLPFDPNSVLAPGEGFTPQFFSADVPTLSEWGMLILSGLLLTSLVYTLVRRRRGAPA